MSSLHRLVRGNAPFGLVLLAASIATAQPVDDPRLDEMARRIDKLEKQNEYLHRIIETGLRPAPDAAPAAAGADPKAVEKIVNDHLKAHEDKRKKDEEDKRKQAEAAGHVVGSDLAFRAAWNNGLNFETAQKDFRVHIGGRFQNDWGFVSADDNLENLPNGLPRPPPTGLGGDLQDGAIFRRARLQVDGTIWEVVDWVAEFDFAGGSPVQLTDVYLNLSHLPLAGNFRAGHFKEPFGLEQLTSDNFTTFMERSLQDEAFVPGRNAGMMLTNTAFDQRMTWAIGMFRSESNISGDDRGDGELAYTGRLTVVPVYAGDGRCVLHLGVCGSHRNQNNDAEILLRNDPGFRFRTRPEIRALSTAIGTEVFFTNSANVFTPAEELELLGLEAAVVYGPLSIQSEYVHALVVDAFRPLGGAQRAPLGDFPFSGYYVQASYFLTGEHRPYLRNTAAFGRVRPHEPFFFVNRECGTCLGKGAWELAVRYSTVDLDDDAVIDLGNERNVTVALNWYLNPNVHFQWNYILAHRDAPGGPAGDGDARILGMRFHIDF